MKRLVDINEDYINENINKWNYTTEVATIEIILDMFENGYEDERFRKWHSDDICELVDRFNDLTIKQTQENWSTESILSVILMEDSDIRIMIQQMMSDLYMRTDNISVNNFITEMYEICRLHISAILRSPSYYIYSEDAE